eukprot:GHVT01098237.1.p1 GENE.GHVT01098237.1~~GHVT01098237.1.p1  ORF type:complete len:772 (-),score=149.66 GHVT01098237.1:15-2069(-)
MGGRPKSAVPPSAIGVEAAGDSDASLTATGVAQAAVLNAPTGSGKTLAFLLPLLQHVQLNTGGPQVLILTPSRELAAQTARTIRALTTPRKDAAGSDATPAADASTAPRVGPAPATGQPALRVGLYIGGTNVKHQLRQLRGSQKDAPQVVCCTPGRLVDLLRHHQALDLSHCRYVVFDEADLLLEHLAQALRPPPATDQGATHSGEDATHTSWDAPGATGDGGRKGYNRPSGDSRKAAGTLRQTLLYLQLIQPNKQDIVELSQCAFWRRRTSALPHMVFASATATTSPAVRIVTTLFELAAGANAPRNGGRRHTGKEHSAVTASASPRRGRLISPSSELGRAQEKSPIPLHENTISSLDLNRANKSCIVLSASSFGSRDASQTTHSQTVSASVAPAGTPNSASGVSRSAPGTDGSCPPCAARPADEAAGNFLPENVAHVAIETQPATKLETLLKVLHADPVRKLVLIFCNSQGGASWLSDWLKHRLGVSGALVYLLTGQRNSAERSALVRQLAAVAGRQPLQAISGTSAVCVATELAARGLDFPGLTHVVNFDLPTDSQHYLHRAGRVGRSGNPGAVLSLSTAATSFIIRRHTAELRVPLRFADVYAGRLWILKRPLTRWQERGDGRPCGRPVSPLKTAPPTQTGRGRMASTARDSSPLRSTTVQPPPLQFACPLVRAKSRVSL